MACYMGPSNGTDGNNIQSLISFQNHNRPGSIPLNYVIDCSMQKVYGEVQRLLETFSGKTDMEKKMEIAIMLSRSRHLFIRLLALVKWANSASKVDKCENNETTAQSEKISNFLDEQSMFLLETANVLSRMTRETLVGARLPPFGVVLATDVLTKKTYTRLPTCVKNKFIPSGMINKWEKLEALVELNKLIQYRLSTIVLPLQMRSVKIKNGRAIFSVPNEFQITLTLMSDVLDFPWRILSVKILVSNPVVGKGRPLVHPLQTKFLIQQLQARVLVKSLEKRNPIIHLYEMLHSFCTSLQLDLFHDQAQRLIRSQLADALSLASYHVGSELTLAYWRQLAEPREGRPSAYYSVCIHIDTLDHHQPLRITHSPDLPLKDQINIAPAIRTEFPSLELLMTRTIAVRSKKILEDLRMELLSLCPGPVTLLTCPLLLELSLLHPCLSEELVHLQVQPYLGTVQARLASPHSSQLHQEVAFYLQQLSTAVNKQNNRAEIAQTLTGLCLWLGLTRSQRSLWPYHVSMTTTLPLVTPPEGHPITDMMATAKQNRSPLLFVKILKTNDHYLVVQPASEGLGLAYHFYLLTAQYCSHDGTLVTREGPSLAQRFLRPASFRRLDVTRMQTANPGTSMDGITKQLSHLRSCRTSRKRRAVSHMLSLLSSVNESVDGLPSCSKRSRLDPSFANHEDSEEFCGTVPVLPQLLALAEENIMMTALIDQLDRAGIQHNGIELIGAKSIPVIRIQGFPVNSGTELWSAGEKALSNRSKTHQHILSYTILAQRRNPRCWQIDVVLLPRLVTSPLQSKRRRIFSTHPMLRLEDTGELVRAMFLEWAALCALQTLTMDLETHQIPSGVLINEFTNLNSLSVSYGPEHCYTAKIIRERGHTNDRGFELVLCTTNSPSDVAYPAINPHLVIQEHLHKLINRAYSLRQLVDVLLETLDFMIALDPLRDSTLVYQTILSTASSQLVKNTSLLATSTHNLLLTYRGTFTLHLSLLPGCFDDSSPGSSLVCVEDVCGTPLTLSNPCCQPVSYLKEFLEGVQSSFNFDQSSHPGSSMTVDQLFRLCRPSAGSSPAVSPLQSFLSAGLLLYTARTTLNTEPGLCNLRATSTQRPSTPATFPQQQQIVVLELASSDALHELILTSHGRGENSTPPLWILQLKSRSNREGWSPERLQLIDRYFNRMISVQELVVPNALISFLRLFTLPLRGLRDITQCMSWELGLSPLSHHRLHVALIGMLPSLTPSFQCNLGQPAVLLKEPNLCYLQLAISHSTNPGVSFYLVISYDTTNNTITQVLPVNPPLWSPQQMLVGQKIKASAAEASANALTKQNGDETSPLFHYFNFLSQQTQLW